MKWIRYEYTVKYFDASVCLPIAQVKKQNIVQIKEAPGILSQSYCLHFLRGF